MAQNPFSVNRVQLSPILPECEANIRQRYEIEKASWIWHSGGTTGRKTVLLFRNEFRVEERADTVIHVSADQRYELSLDGKVISMGPDRSDVEHWSFASYALSLAPGSHVLEALVWWIGSAAPVVQMTYRGGFIFAAEGALGRALNTGEAGWKVADITSAWSFEHDAEDVQHVLVGRFQTVSGRELLAGVQKSADPLVVAKPMENAEWFGVRGGWRLYPSVLPDQFRRVVAPGKVIAVIEGGLSPEETFKDEYQHAKAIPTWQKLISDGQDLTVPADSIVSVLWDLDGYFCGYGMAELEGGEGSSVSMSWAEALFEKPLSRADKYKGNRNEVVGKYFRGLRDTFRNDGLDNKVYRSCWWRSGRYILVTVQTADKPLKIKRLSLLETRYPLENESTLHTDVAAVEAVEPLCLRGLQMCAHETFVDCPHYEQTLYVGDTRIHNLVSYTLSHDSRLARRCIELFDWSRKYFGFTNSAYPAGPQLICTFPLYWVLMVKDYAWWRDDPSFIKNTMPGVRCNLEEFARLRNADGLVHPAPGWAFVDTVPEWAHDIYGPSVDNGPSALINLLYVHALQNAAELEKAFGEDILAEHWLNTADEIMRRITDLCWSAERGLMSDDQSHTRWSEHAQVLTVLTAALPVESLQICFNSMLDAQDLAGCQEVFWMFYLFEVMYEFDRGDLILEKLKYWSNLEETGFFTPPEMYEPSRSDCHGWGSHPLFHLRASIAGIRPSGPGFSTVRISPSRGRLKIIETRVPHPKGFIEASMNFSEPEKCLYSVTLPEGLSGRFIWKGTEMDLGPGHQEGTCTA